MHRFADRFTDRRVEINNLMVLQDHPLVDYGKYALGCMTGTGMKKCVYLKSVRDELLRSMEEKRQFMANYRDIGCPIFHFMNMGTPPKFQTPIRSQPGSSDWQRQVPEKSASHYWQPLAAVMVLYEIRFAVPSHKDYAKFANHRLTSLTPTT
ncbi:hypothetical protein Tco_0443499 [Tanacetum coccineum]